MSVELNNVFYHLPSIAAIEHWRECTPAGFVFAVKASGYVKHMKKLKHPLEAAAFFERLHPLVDKLGPILFQLSWRWRDDP